MTHPQPNAFDRGQTGATLHLTYTQGQWHFRHCPIPESAIPSIAERWVYACEQGTTALFTHPSTPIGMLERTEAVIARATVPVTKVPPSRKAPLPLNLSLEDLLGDLL